jgi:hypothetical protein
VSRRLTLAALDSQLELYIEEPIEVSNYNMTMQVLIMLDYAIELYTLWHINYPRAHTSRNPFLKLARYLKLFLG